MYEVLQLLFFGLLGQFSFIPGQSICILIILWQKLQREPIHTIIAVVGYILLVVISAQRANKAAIHNNTQIDTFQTVIREKELAEMEKLNKKRADAMNSLEPPPAP